jgi:ribosomal protein L34E
MLVEGVPRGDMPNLRNGLRPGGSRHNHFRKKNNQQQAPCHTTGQHLSGPPPY